MLGKVKINKDTAVLFFCLLAYIVPESLLNIPGVSTLYNAYRILIAGYIVVRFVSSRINKSSFVFIWVVFELWILLMTLLRNGTVFYAVREAMLIVSSVMLFDLYKDRQNYIYKALYYMLEFFIYINLVTIVLYPDGMYVTGDLNYAYENWFLGFKNKHIIYFLPAVGVSTLISKTEGYNLRRVLLIAVSYGSALYTQSSTGILVLSVFLVVCFVPFFKKHYRVFNIKTYFLIAVTMFIIIPLFRLQYIFSFLIVNVMKKDLNLTYRTDLWDRAFSAIAQHPITGWGEQSNDIKHALYNSSSIITAHNQILEYLYIGGIILLILYIIINVKLIKHVIPYEQESTVQVASTMYLALQIALIVEVYVDASMYMIYFITWYACAICGSRRPVVRRKTATRRRKTATHCK